LIGTGTLTGTSTISALLTTEPGSGQSQNVNVWRATARPTRWAAARRTTEWKADPQ
jgi:hypothetical protein